MWLEQFAFHVVKLSFRDNKKQKIVKEGTPARDRRDWLTWDIEFFVEWEFSTILLNRLGENIVFFYMCKYSPSDSHFYHYVDCRSLPWGPWNKYVWKKNTRRIVCAHVTTNCVQDNINRGGYSRMLFAVVLMICVTFLIHSTYVCTYIHTSHMLLGSVNYLLIFRAQNEHETANKP